MVRAAAWTERRVSVSVSGRRTRRRECQGRCWPWEGGELSSRLAYLYFMHDNPDRVRAAVPNHIAHWQSLGLRGYLGGPFADGTGGLITFEAENVE